MIIRFTGRPERPLLPALLLPQIARNRRSPNRNRTTLRIRTLELIELLPRREQFLLLESGSVLPPSLAWWRDFGMRFIADLWAFGDAKGPTDRRELAAPTSSELAAGRAARAVVRDVRSPPRSASPSCVRVRSAAAVFLMSSFASIASLGVEHFRCRSASTRSATPSRRDGGLCATC